MNGRRLTTRNRATRSPTIVLGQDFVHEHDGDADHDHDHFDFDADGPLEDNPLWIAGPRHADQRRHRHRLGRHAGHLLPHQPAPLRRGPDQPLLRGRRARPCSSRRSRSRPIQSEERIDDAALARHHRRGLRGGRAQARRHRHRRGDPHRRGAAARERAGDRRPAGRAAAAISSPPPPATTWRRCWRPTARARRASRTTRASASSTSTSAAAPPSSRVVEKGNVIATAARAHRRPAAGGRRDRPHRAARSGRPAPRRAGRLRLEQAATCARRAQLDKVAECMADALIAAITHAAAAARARAPLSDRSDRRARPHRRRDVLRRRRRIRLRPRGPRLRRHGTPARPARSAQRIDAGALPWPLLPAGECIRATALGASEYSVQLSGNTSYISKPGRAAAAPESAGAAAALRLRAR